MSDTLHTVDLEENIINPTLEKNNNKEKSISSELTLE